MRLLAVAIFLGGVIVGIAFAANHAGDMDWTKVTLPDLLHDSTTTTTWTPPTAPTTTTRPPPPTTATTLGFLNLDDIVRSQAGIAGYDGDRALEVGGDACRRMDAGVTIAGLGDPQMLGIAVGVLCPWHFMGALDNGWITAGDVEQ